jgi:phosphoribosylformimino-5-aminoimidazole carboxamide ribotide isomerase
MIIFPAIDIRGGRCVRLVKGDFNKETVFANNPADMAKRWCGEGAKFLHVVDLDGALKGRTENAAAIKEILQAINIPMQLGGGIRTLKNIETVLEMGVARVILGSVAVKNPALVKEACREFGSEAIVAGIDAKDGIVAVEGWGVSGDVQAEELAKRMREAGVLHIVYTDISRDGTLTGVNVAATASLAKASGVKVIASGGVSSLDDIKKVKREEKSGIEGVIAGKAIYTGALDLKAALALAEEA